ncbi:Dynein heavy chain [Spironucleus salmonicida]|uniref:Dynein heavy chain n=1 Tax=Spironucleus salmonicida TaxID=348837 RepID=V6LU11_9EUKA|nr:Dynein heavy chain [Spironucleus salmonicida]|eukprot:EST47718.1 Dynein heavy chain [Spironucleus salmonicida]
MEDQFDDPRANWMRPRVASSLKIKEDKFIKSASENDHTAVLMNFFESEEVHTVFVYENKQGDLIIADRAPEVFRRKAIYFTKAAGVARLEKDKPIKDSLFYGDYTPNVVQMLRTKLDYMYLPLLKAEQFTKDWPDMLYQDVVKQSDKFSQVIYTTEGKIQGKCLLPIPSEAASIYSKICVIAQESESATLSIISQLDKQSRDSAHDVEAVVLDWIKQIRVVINTQPEDIIKGSHPLPMEEIDFWVHKTDNLNSIIDQLNTEKAKVVIEVLKSIDSTYYPALIKTIEEVHQTLAECNSNTQFLTPLRPLFQQLLDEADIAEASNILQAIFKALYIIWFHAPFYNSSTRYIFLIRSLCNLIIKQMRTILEGENILKNEPSDSLILVENVSRLADDFIILYKKYAEKVVEDCREMGDQSQEDSNERQRISQALIQLQHEYIEKQSKNKKKQLEKIEADQAADAAAVEEKAEPEETKEAPVEEAEPQEEEKVSINAYRRYKFNKGCWPTLSLVFKRFEAFVERIKDIHRVITINACMQRLEKLEVGGVQGDSLSKQIQQIFALYNAKTAIFLESTYDPTDLQIDMFEEDHAKFIKHYTSWEKRLVAVLETGIDSSITLEQAITVVESFSGILPEAVLKNVVQAKFGHFNNMFLALLQKIFDEFTTNKDDPPLEKNQPPLSGAVMWSRVLLNKTRVPYKKLDALNIAYLERAESIVKDDRFEISRQKFLEIVQKLKEYEIEQHQRWLSGIDMVCTEKLAEKLIIRVQPNLIEFQNDVYITPEGITRNDELDLIKLIKTNFSIELTDLMEETKIFKILDMEVSEDALEVFAKADAYRQTKIQLDVIQNQYNFVQKQLVFVERPLFYPQLQYIESMLVDGIDKLTWKDSTADINIFLDKLNLPLNVLFMQVSTLKDNINSIQQLLVAWSKIVLVDKPAKAPVSLDKTPDTIQTKLNQIKDTQSQKITEAVENSKQAVFFTPTEEKPSSEEETKVMELIGFNSEQLVQYWDLYLLWLAEYIQCGLLDIVVTNVKYLQKYMDESETIEHNELDNLSAIINESSYPFIEINMLIRHPDLFFEPQVQSNATKLTLEQTLSQWIDSFCNVAKCVPNPTQSCTDDKLKSSNDFRDFHFNIMRNPKFIAAKDKLKNRVIKRAHMAADQEQNYEKYKPVYQTDRKAYLQRFLKDGPNVPLSGEYDTEAMADKTQHIVRTIVKQNSQTQEDNGEEGKEGEQNQKTDNGPTVQTIEMELKYYRIPDIYDFNDAIEKYRNIREEVSQNVPLTVRIGWLQINVRSAKTSLLQLVDSFKDLFTNHLIASTNSRLQNLSAFCNNAKAKLQSEIVAGQSLEDALIIQKDIKDNTLMYDTMFEPIKELMQMLQRHNIQFAPEVSSLVESLPKEWEKVKQISYNKREELAPLVQEETQKTFESVKVFQNKVWDFKEHFKSKGPFLRDVGIDRAYEMLDTCLVELGELRDQALFLTEKQKLFDSSFANDKEMEEINLIANLQKELVSLKLIWDITDMVESQLGSWNNTLFKDVDVEYMEENMKKFVKEIRSVDRMSRGNDAYVKLDNLVKNFLKTLPLIQKLRSHAMRGRHWEQLKELTKVSFTIDDKFQLSDLIKLNLHEHSDAVEEIVSKAEKELSMEKQLTALNQVWKDLNFNFIHHGDVNLIILTQPMLEEDAEQIKSGKELLYNIQVPEEVADQLEQDQLAVQNMVSNKYVKFFYDEVMDWQKKLAQVDSVIQVWSEVQRTWSYLYPIFIGSQDIREQLPEDSKRFEQMNESWIVAMNSAVWISNCIESAQQAGLQENLEQMQEKLQKCEKALADYLDTKRRLFPRFYFVSSVDLLDILSKGQQPKQVERHLSKIFDNMHALKWTTDDALCKEATAMVSGENEIVQLHANCLCDGPVESWLNKLVVYMMDTLRSSLLSSLQQFQDMDREKWLDVYPAQICLVALQNFWTSDTGAAFERLEEGNEQALKEYNKKQNDALLNFITMTQGDLDKNMRTKIATICTIEVHSKDIVAALIRDKVEVISAFAWQSQLKFRWDEQQQDCYVNICDAEFLYTYEYLGCTARLVVTALTDRCYITLTQSLHLILGGAPAGPAGTGKTETTKDLGRALGRMVYVFNCSPEMDYRSLGNIFYGLSLSGSWGCFDEFNRIEVEVLSVVAMQVKTVLDAIRADKQYFTLGDEEERPGMPKAKLNKQVGYFITMNPGYAGRAELPDNLKALFRGVAMVVPDFCQITEIMLISNGFMAARELAKKFITLYNLNKELLSKQDHYDWGLRAIIAICRTAGMLRRTMIAPIKKK